MHLDTPIKTCYTLTEEPGVLRIYGNCYNLTSPESPALLLRKQSSYNEKFITLMNFRPTRVGYESGVVLWWNQYSFASIGVTAVKDSDSVGYKQTLILRKPTGTNGEFKVRSKLIIGHLWSFSILNL